MTKRPCASVTTIRANFVGSSVVSAITQTPASGPLALFTTPPMSSSSIAGACASAGACNRAAKASSASAAAKPVRGHSERSIISSFGIRVRKGSRFQGAAAAR
jgi:hypothetical protein